MLGPYEKNGKGMLWVPSRDEEDKVRTTKAIGLVESLEEAIKAENMEEPWLGSHDAGSFETEEIYVADYDEPELRISGHIGDVFVSIDVPLEDDEEMRALVKNIAETVDAELDDSLTTVLKGFRPRLTELGEVLGWEHVHDMDVTYDMVEKGDVVLGLESRNESIGSREMDRIRSIVPEAEKVEFLPGVDSGKPSVWIYLDEGETGGSE